MSNSFKFFISIVFIFLFFPKIISGQFNIQVTVDNGNSTTTCTDPFGAPDPMWSVRVNWLDWVDYPSDANCYEDTPNLQYNQTFNCFSSIPPMLSVCFRAFENDPNPFNNCDISMTCMEEICVDFPIPLQGSSNHTLSLPANLASGGSVDFTINTSGIPGAINDFICNAIDFGVIPFGTTAGDAQNSIFNNNCATNWNEPNPNTSGANWNNDAAVWFKFTTDSSPGSIYQILATSDPSGVGDPLNMQLALYQTDDNTCMGNLSLVTQSFIPFDDDEEMVFNCLNPNETYFVMMDGRIDIPDMLYGYYGFSISDIGSIEGDDLICDFNNLGTVPDAGVLNSPLSSNVCATNIDDPSGLPFSTQQSVWFSFSPPSTGHVTIEALSDANSFDPVNLEFTVFSSSDNSCTGNLQAIASAFGSPDLNESVELSCLDPSQTYFILVDGANGNTSGLFNLNVIDAGEDTPVFNESITLCAGEIYTIGDSTYTASGIFTTTFLLPNGCDSMVVTDLTVLNNLEITLDILMEATDEGVADGNAVAGAIGGTETYSFEWSDGQMTGAVNNLIGGDNYCVTVTDSNNCQDDTCFVMPFILDFIPLIQNDSLNCNGDSDGILELSAHSGVPPYNFNWSNPSGTLTGNGTINIDNETVFVPNLPEGTYNITMTDGFFDTTFVGFVWEPTPISLDSEMIEDASCFGECDGNILIEISGGTPPYQYNWSNLYNGNDPSLLCDDNYIVTVTDANGCTEIYDFNVAEPTEFLATALESQSVSCFQGDDGIISVSTNGNPTQYFWDTGDMSETVNNLSANFYAVTVTNFDGCTATSSIQLTEPSEPVGVTIIENKNISCKGENDGILEAIPNGPGNNFTFSWEHNDFDGIAENLNAGNYSVTVTNENGCSANTSFALSEPDEMVVDLITIDVTCIGNLIDGFIGIENVVGGFPPYSYSLDGDNFQQTPWFDSLIADSYTLFVQDLGGCTKQVNTLIADVPDLSINLPDDIILPLGDSITIEPSTLALPNLEYAWSPSELLECRLCPVVTLKPTETTTYSVFVIDVITGCSSQDAITIEVDKTRRLFIPNVFSPNGDGFNDEFMFYGGDDVTLIKNFQVFGRQGEQIFRANNFFPEDVNNSWNGTYNGKKMNPGVFVWFAEVEFIDGEVEILKGDILLLR